MGGERLSVEGIELILAKWEHWSWQRRLCWRMFLAFVCQLSFDSG